MLPPWISTGLLGVARSLSEEPPNRKPPGEVPDRFRGHVCPASQGLPKIVAAYCGAGQMTYTKPRMNELSDRLPSASRLEHCAYRGPGRGRWQGRP